MLLLSEKCNQCPITEEPFDDVPSILLWLKFVGIRVSTRNHQTVIINSK